MSHKWVMTTSARFRKGDDAMNGIEMAKYANQLEQEVANLKAFKDAVFADHAEPAPSATGSDLPGAIDNNLHPKPPVADEPSDEQIERGVAVLRDWRFKWPKSSMRDLSRAIIGAALQDNTAPSVTDKPTQKHINAGGDAIHRLICQIGTPRFTANELAKVAYDAVHAAIQDSTDRKAGKDDE